MENNQISLNIYDYIVSKNHDAKDRIAIDYLGRKYTFKELLDNMNIVMAINMGGDDFIVKPFDINVLIAKVQAMLRRTYSFAESTNIIEHNGCILNINDQTFTYNGKRMELTKNEYRILQSLLENIGKVVSRDNIMMKLWESDDFIDDNTLTVNVTRLRKKLEQAGLKDYIKTKKGTGYIIE